MVKMVGLDDDLYDKVVKIVDNQPIEFPSIKNFIDKAIQREVEKYNSKLNDE